MGQAEDDRGPLAQGVGLVGHVTGASRNLILRSDPKDRISKDGPKRRPVWPSFETLAALAPQDEGR